MKVLSVLQPWATLIVIGAKTIEVRRWQTHYRGPLLIHASKRKPNRAETQQFVQNKHFKKFTPDLEALPYGAIIGSVVLNNIVSTTEALCCKIDVQQELAFDNFGPNRSAWILSDPCSFDHILPMKGSLSLWEYNGLI